MGQQDAADHESKIQHTMKSWVNQSVIKNS